MSTQPRPGTGAMALLGVGAGRVEREPQRRDALAGAVRAGEAAVTGGQRVGAVGSGTMSFATAQPSVGVMLSLIAPVAGLVAL